MPRCSPVKTTPPSVVSVAPVARSRAPALQGLAEPAVRPAQTTPTPRRSVARAARAARAVLRPMARSVAPVARRPRCRPPARTSRSAARVAQAAGPARRRARPVGSGALVVQARQLAEAPRGQPEAWAEPGARATASVRTALSAAPEVRRWSTVAPAEWPRVVAAARAVHGQAARPDRQAPLAAVLPPSAVAVLYLGRPDHAEKNPPSPGAQLRIGPLPHRRGPMPLSLRVLRSECVTRWHFSTGERGY